MSGQAEDVGAISGGNGRIGTGTGALPGAGRTRRRVSGMPVLTARDLVRRPGPVALPVAADRLSLWYSGRTALWQGLAWLGLGPGDRVLAPAFACGAEINVLLGAGLTVDYYRVGDDLVPDLDDLAGLSARPARAVLVTHYFGWAQPLDALLDFAAARGLWMLEDAAHAFYSADDRDRPLGSRGDIGIWSFNKTLAITDGAALVVRNPRGRTRGPGDHPDPWRVAGRMKALIEVASTCRHPVLTGLAKRWLLDPLVGSVKTIRGVSPERSGPGTLDPHRQRVAFAREQATWRMSGLARYMLSRALPRAEVIARRRANYERIREGLDGVRRARPFFRSLPPGCCPMLFPLLADDGPGLRTHLLAHGVVVERFGSFHEAVPWSRFPLETRLQQDLLLLPLHQGLDAGSVASLAAMVRGWDEQTR